MKIREYSYLCSQKLLNDLSSQKYVDSLGFYNDDLKIISDSYAPDKDIDERWMLISTALLMSEGLFKDSKTYNYITDEVLLELENVLGSTGCISDNNLLDIHNNPVYDFASFFPGGEPPENNDFDYSDDYYEELDKIDYSKREEDDCFFDDFQKQREDERLRAMDANSSFIVNGEIKIINFIKMVRNALAHSSYEILDKDRIRLSHYNHDTKKLDLNVVLNKDIIIPIIDIVNEVVYQRYSEFYEYCFVDDLSYLTCYGPEETDDKLLLDFIMSYDIFDERVAKQILEDAKKTKLFYTPSYDLDILNPEKEDYDNENQLKAILNTMKEYIKPICDYGIIINDMFYTNNGQIDSDELMDKYAIYSYLRGSFYESAYSMPNEQIYIENEMRLKILSLLNALLLTTMNEVHNYNLPSLNLDFSAMYLPKEIVELFEEKQLKKNTGLLDRLKDFFSASKLTIEKLEERNKIKKDLLKTRYRDNDYFNVVLPQEIEAISLQIENLKKERISKGKLFLEIDSNPIDYNYNENLSNYILNALRNSLAHGNVTINDEYDDMGGILLTFEDYDPDNPSELTFKGEVSLKDLLLILINDENLNVLRRTT